MFDFRRTCNCNALNKSNVGQEVTLSGWVHRRRDHGGLIFIDLRDRYGLTQVIFDPKLSKEIHEKAKVLRSEWVISIKGKVRPRSEGMANPNLNTGEIEVEVLDFEILSPAKTPPFSICDERIDVSEDLRLKFRYLDIRRGEICKNLAMRHKAMLSVRNFLDSQGFLEITTPILSKSTPEGARDYLVPSRIYPGNFYALPQSPQMFKQLFMVSGMDRYFQIAQCFRDEDMRSDRQPEFTQIDAEMSFGTPEDLFVIFEGLLKKLYKDCLNIDIPTPFRHMNHKDAMENYGTDRPDLRFDMKLIRLDDIAKKSSFSIFQEQLKAGGVVKALCVKGGADISRRVMDEYTAFVKEFGLSGLATVKRTDKEFTTGIAKFFTEDLQKELLEKTKAENNDLIIFAADKEDRVNQSLDHLRRRIAKDRNLIDKKKLEFLWIVDFPMFSFDEKENRLKSEHHPFTSPNFDDIKLLDTDPVKARAQAYDIVLNGYEIGGGSQRIHSSELQHKIFQILNLSEKDIQNKFGFFIEALQYGTPPHLGIALGLDRVVMLLCDTDNIRDVIAYPKTQKATDLMTASPSEVSQKQLDELKLKVQK